MVDRLQKGKGREFYEQMLTPRVFRVGFKQREEDNSVKLDSCLTKMMTPPPGYWSPEERELGLE